MRSVKKEVLHIVESFVQRTNDLDYVAANLLPSLLEAVLTDYNVSIESARGAEVLTTMTTLVERLGVSKWFATM
jgi:exportin-1